MKKQFGIVLATVCAMAGIASIYLIRSNIESQENKSTKKIDSVESYNPKVLNAVELTFTDVPANAWYTKAVKYVKKRGYMRGKSDEIFAPADLLTRAEFVTILHNMQGKPEVEYQPKFSDVDDGKWYTKPIMWAYQNGITVGYGDRFGVSDPITREQMALMLYSYARQTGYDLSIKEDALTKFGDVDKISKWALNPVLWAVSQGIINGKATEVPTIDPLGKATRAECAQMIKSMFMVKSDKYPVYTDEDGEVYDLGGMEIIVRDWWSGDGEMGNPANEYEEATREYLDWIQETYHFKIKRMGVSFWDEVNKDFSTYASAPADDKNYLFVLREDAELISAINNGLCYDLASLDCLDFSESKFTDNLVHKKYTRGNKIYGMNSIQAETRTGVYFNKKVLREAGIDPESIYDMQASGTWTWEKFTELLALVQRDTDGDGNIDIWGADGQSALLEKAAVFSNGGEFVGKDSAGKYTYKLENPETLEGLKYATAIIKQYFAPMHLNNEGTQIWDYYRGAFGRGEYAFLIEDSYAGQKGQYLENMKGEYGFVAFPKGPNATDYTNVWYSNVCCIPANYDADRAWKIAFAWNLYTTPTVGYENSDLWQNDYYTGGFDERAIKETIAMLRKNGSIDYADMIPNVMVGYDVLWEIPKERELSEIVAAARDKWKVAIAQENQNF